MSDQNQYYNEFQNVHDHTVIAKILGVKSCPVDKNKKSLVHIKQTEVRSGILPENFFGIIHTPSPQPCLPNGNVQVNRSNRGSDDNTYKQHLYLQLILPRCYSILRIFRVSDSRCVAKHIVQGYYKFGGSARDEDSNISTSGLFEQAPLQSASRVVLTEKSNGKAAVFTMFYFESELYVFGGSKGQHYVARMAYFNQDLAFLSSKQFAKPIFNVFQRIQCSLSNESQNEFIERMVGKNSSNDGQTACGEFEDGKHMVPLPLDKNGKLVPFDLKMFGLVNNSGVIKPNETFCEDVVFSLNWFKRLGFPYTHFDVRTPKEIEEIRDSLRSGSLREGYVLHQQVCDKVSGKYKTIAVEKYKLWWYIVIRLLREFMRGPNNLDNFENKLWKRLNTRNASYMKMPIDMLNRWYALLKMFVYWFIQKGYDSDLNSIFIGHDSLGMGFVWREFLFDTKVDDTFGTGTDPVTQAFEKLSLEAHSESIPNRSTVVQVDHDKSVSNSKSTPFEISQTQKTVALGVLVVFQGIPGIGKSMLTEYLIKDLHKHCINSIGLEQDPFYAKYGQKRSGRMCLNQFIEYAKSGEYQVVFLQRNNANYKQFMQYANEAKKLNQSVHVISPKSLLKDPHLALTCLQSVLKRPEHATFKDLSMAKQFLITMAFFILFEIPKPAKACKIDFLDQISWVKDDLPVLSSSVYEYLMKFRDYMADGDNPFDKEPQDEVEMIKNLELETADYQSWRNTPEEISKQVINALMNKSLLPFRFQAHPSNFIQKDLDLDSIVIENDMEYAALVINDQARQVLNERIDAQKLDMTGLTETVLHHSTLVYNNKSDPKSRKIQEQAIVMEKLKTVLGINVTGIAYEPSKCLAFTVVYTSEVGLNKGISLNWLCDSGHPHITGILAKDVEPKYSIELLKKLSVSGHDTQIRYFQFRTPIAISGKVTIFRYASGRSQSQYHNRSQQSKSGRGSNRYRRRGGRRGRYPTNRGSGRRGGNRGRGYSGY